MEEQFLNVINKGIKWKNKVNKTIKMEEWDEHFRRLLESVKEW